MDVVRHQMSFLYLAFLLAGQFAKHLPKVHPQLAVKRLPAALGDEHDGVFALQRRVAQTFT